MNNKDLKQLIKKEYTYPELDDNDFQKKIFRIKFIKKENFIIIKYLKIK